MMRKCDLFQLTWSGKLWTCGGVGGEIAGYSTLAHIASYLTISGREEEGREREGVRREIESEREGKKREGEREEGRERGEILLRIYLCAKVSTLQCHVKS